ncbi:MAG: hypothetical protein AAB895_00495 [Patescibacteria group bacterium]
MKFLKNEPVERTGLLLTPFEKGVKVLITGNNGASIARGVLKSRSEEEDFLIFCVLIETVIQDGFISEKTYHESLFWEGEEILLERHKFSPEWRIVQ